MLKQPSSTINRGAGGTPMIDFLDEKISSIKQRIAKFKKDYSELYEEENERKYNPNLDYQKLINEPLSPPIPIKEKLAMLQKSRKTVEE